MVLEDFVKLHNDLLLFEFSEPIAVIWNENNGLVYRQIGKVQALSYLDNYYFPKPKLKLGVLMPTDLRMLMDTLESLIQDPALKSNQLNSVICPYGIKLYKLFNGLPGPQLVYDIKLVSFTNRWISHFTLYRYSLNSKILLKAIINENRASKNKYPKD